jgi:uncharacterized protein Yka (UPF0111/DUF47 family)
VPFSLTPKDSSFYPLFTASAENLVAATDVLSEFIHDHARRPELAGKLRDLEHAGDQTTHAIFKQLNTSFVTPFDREDIYRLASKLDDVMDYMEAAADLVVLYNLGELPEDGVRRLVAGVLEFPELLRELVAARVVVDELAEHLGGGHEVLRRCGEQRVEARVLGRQAEGHAWLRIGWGRGRRPPRCGRGPTGA